MTRMMVPGLSLLRDRCILVAEDEYMIADEIAQTLTAAGARALGPVARVGDALRLLGSDHVIDGAVLDVNLHNEPVWPVVDVLLTRQVPLLLATGYDASAIPLGYATLPRYEKPATGHDLTRALAGIMAARED